MSRDPGLEELVHSALGDLSGLTDKAMFGGWAFLLNGNLLCGVRQSSLMLRVGRENETWALEISGVVPVVMRGRRMHGYVRAAPEAYSDDTHRQRLSQCRGRFHPFSAQEVEPREWLRGTKIPITRLSDAITANPDIRTGCKFGMEVSVDVPKHQNAIQFRSAGYA